MPQSRQLDPHQLLERFFIVGEEDFQFFMRLGVDG